MTGISQEVFKFSEEARRDMHNLLRQPRRRFAAEDIDGFLAEAAWEIDYWQREFPPITGKAMVNGRRRLYRIVKHLHKLQQELRLLPQELRTPIWLRLSENREAFPLSVRLSDHASLCDHMNAVKRQILDLSLPALMGVVNEQIDFGAMTGRREYARKARLVEFSAELFHEWFGRRPTAVPSGAFMDAMSVIGNAVGITIGKDSVDPVLKQLRMQR